MKKMTLSKKNKAYTLIEFMVAITIGLILLAGLTYIFMGMRQSNTAQRVYSDMQESARFALYFLTNEIQSAGWADVESNSFGFYTSPAFNFSGGTATSDGGAINVSDRITVRYEADTDCLGANVGGIVENSFYVDGDRLMCQGNGGGTAQPIISGVQGLHFLYGIDSDGTNASPNKYVRADQIAVSERESISTVKIILVLVSDSDINQASKAQSFTIPLEPASITVTDRKVRKIFSTTVSVPNKPSFAISS